MAKKKVEGTCHLCGIYGKLSFEHVPPKAAFNDQPAVGVGIDGAFETDAIGQRKGVVSQKGAGGYTLCERCNNITGKRFARDYISFCYQAASYIFRNEGAPSLACPYYIYPLRAIKQIITMVASVDGESFSVLDPELTAFVLDRDRRYLNPKYRVFLYFNLEGVSRRIGRNSMVVMNLNESSTPKQVTEVSHFPFGFVFTGDGTRPADNLVEITHFSRYEYKDFEMIQLQLPDLPTYLGIPLDYRSKDEIDEQVRKSHRDYPANIM